MAYYTGTLIFLLLLTVIIGLGSRIASVAKIGFRTKAEKAVFSYALGFGVISYLILALGAARFLYSSVMVPVLIVIGILVLPEIRNLISFVSSSKKSVFSPEFVLAAAISLILLLAALAPSYSNDSMVYHLTDAKYFANYHYIGLISNNSTNALWPYMVEMYFTLLLLFKLPAALGLVQFSLYIACAFAVYAFCQRYLTRQAGWLAVLIFMLVPGIFMDTLQTYVDIGAALYCFLAIYAFLVWVDVRKRRWLVLSSVMTGFALSVKYFSLIILFILLPYYVYLFLRGKIRSGSEFVKLGAIFILGVLASSSAWYIRQYIVLGNPFFPFFQSIFGLSGLDPEAMKQISETTIRSSFGLGSSLWDLVKLPWDLVMYPRKFGGEQLGPLFLAVLPAVFFLKKIPKPVKRILIFCAIYFVIWFLQYQNLRFLLAVVPMLSIICAYTVLRLTEKKQTVDRIISAVTGLYLLICFGLLMYYALPGIKVVVGIDNADAYLKRNERSYGVSRFINEALPLQANILIVGDTHSYFIDRPNKRELYYWILDGYDKRFNAEDEVISFFKSEGFTHILFALAPKEEMRSQLSLEALITDPAFKSKHLREIETVVPLSLNSNGMVYKVYEIVS